MTDEPNDESDGELGPGLEPRGGRFHSSARGSGPSSLRRDYYHGAELL